MHFLSAFHSTRTRPGNPARGPLFSAAAVMLAATGCAPPGPRSGTNDLAAWQRSMAVALGDAQLRLRYFANGMAEGPRLVLIHGTPGSGSTWADYLRQPPSGVEVVALDRPGFGDSEPDGPLLSLSAQAQAVAALLPPPGRGAVLLGHSLGGPIAVRVAAEHPQRVSALILLAASLDPAQERIHPMQHVGAWVPVRGLLPRAIRNANAELMALEPQLRELAPLLARVRCPVFIVHGTRDDLVPVANVSYLQAHLTGAACVKTELLQGHNHFLPWNAEAEVRRAIDAAVRGSG